MRAIDGQGDLIEIDKPSKTSYQDYLGNIVHYFDIPGAHTQLILTAQALVEVGEPAALPETWQELDQLVQTDGDLWDMGQPSRFTHPSPLLHDLATELAINRAMDPLTLTSNFVWLK